MNRRDILTNIVVKILILSGKRSLKRMHDLTVNGRAKNDALLFSILKKNSTCEYGRKYGFSEIKTIEDYRSRVPLSTFKDYAEYVERMIEHDESNLITSLPLVGYAQSSGSVGTRKFIPLTMDSVKAYTRYTFVRMFGLADEYYKKMGKGGLKPGRGIFTDPAYEEYLPNGLPCTNAADVPSRRFRPVYPYILITPFTHMFSADQIDYHYLNFRLGLEDKTTMYMFGVFFKDLADHIKYLKNNWETLVNDIETGTISELAHADPETKQQIQAVLKPNPERAAELRIEFEKGFDETIIKRVMPNMQVFGAIGTSTFETFSKLARENSKGIPFDYSIYGASEGLFAAVDELESPKQLLLLDSCYYEFIPVIEDAVMEDQICSIDELKVGNYYEIVITNQSGLYRYRCGDVIKVLDYRNDCPYIQFAYRKGQLLNLTGEKTTEEHMQALIHKIEEMADCRINHWTAYNSTDEFPYHYVLLIENEEGKDLSVYSHEAHELLRSINPRYEIFFASLRLGPLIIWNQEFGTNKAWMQKKIQEGVSPSQVKPVRILDTPEKMEFFLNRIAEPE